MQGKPNTIRTGPGRGQIANQRNSHMPNESQLRSQPSYPMQAHPIMMQGQRQSYMPTHPMAMAQRPVRPNRPMYSSSPQAHSPIHGYLPQQSMQYQVLQQEPYVQQVMRSAYIPNVQPYQVQATSSPFQPQFLHQQQQQQFYQGMAPMYYGYANQPLPAQQQPNPNANSTLQANSISKQKPAKRSNRPITIRDPDSNVDVTEEILSQKSTANGRPGGTPPLSNSITQTKSSAIQAQFAAQVAAAAGDKGKHANEKKVAKLDDSKEHPARTTDQTEDKETKTDVAHVIKQGNGSIATDDSQVIVNNTETAHKVNSLTDEDRTDIAKDTTSKAPLHPASPTLEEMTEKLKKTIDSGKESANEPPKVLLLRHGRETTKNNQNGASGTNEKATVDVIQKGSEITFEAKQINDNMIVPSSLTENLVDDGNIRDESLNDVQNVDDEGKNLDSTEQQTGNISVKTEIKLDTVLLDVKEVVSDDAEVPIQEQEKMSSEGQVMTTIDSPKEPALQEVTKGQEKTEQENALVNKQRQEPQQDKELVAKLQEDNQQPQPNKEVLEVNKEQQEVNKELPEVNKEQQEENKEQPEVNKEQQEVNKEQQEVNKEQQEVNKRQHGVKKEHHEVNKAQQEVYKEQQVVNKEQQVNKQQQEMNKQQQELDNQQEEVNKQLNKVNKQQEEVNKQQQEVNKQEQEVNKQQQQPMDKQQQPDDKQQIQQDNPKPQDKPSQQATKMTEPPKKKSSKQRLKGFKNKETGGDLMDAYTDKPPSQEPVIEEKVKPVEIVLVHSDKPLEEDLSWEDKEEKIGDEIEVEKENEAEPAIPVEQIKRKYERDFLLQFQFMQVCTEKPAGLPNIEVVLDAPVPPTKGGGSQRGGPDFLPSYARQKSQGGGGRRDSRGKPPARKIIAAAPQPPVVLKQSENRWQRPQEKEQELSEEEKKTAELYRHVVAILNKLTPQKFKTLVEQIMALNIDTPGRLEGVIDRIFEKAIGEPVFSVAYANMCRCLFTIKVADVEGKEVSFRKLLLNRCQKEFEKEKEDEQALLEKHNQLERLSEEERKVKKEEMDEALGKNKRRMLGNIKFIGELFKLKLLTENIMHDCIFKLLRAGDEESLESMCKLLFTIGKDLDSEKAKPRIEQYFDQINKVIVAKKISSRVTFMLRDVVELRQNKWIPRREEHYNPKTIDQIHKEAQMEKMQEQRIAASLPAKDNKQKKGGGSGGGRDSPKPVSNDGWITTGKGGKSVSFDPNKLKSIGKRTNNEEISLGPSSRFGQWGRGSSAGLSSTSQEQEPQGNRYSALRDNDTPPSNKPYDPRKSSSSGARPSSAGAQGSDKKQTKGDRDSALEAVRAFTKPHNEKPQNEKQQLVQPPVSSQEKQEVKVSKEPKELVKEPLSEEELIKKTTALIDEYANIQDLSEAIACFTDLHSPGLHHLFILAAVEHTYEMSPRDRRLTGKLFGELLSKNKLTKEQITKGFNSVFEVAPDNAIDYPMLWKYLAEIITAVILGNQFTLRHLKPLIFEHLKPCGKAAALLAEILLTTKDSASESKAIQIWTDLAISWSEVLPEQQSEEDFLSRKNLKFLPKENDELLKLLLTDQFKNDIVFAHIEKNFKEEERKECQFINHLVTAVAESCIINKDKEVGPDCCKEKLKARKDILRKYLDSNNSTLELEALFALQEMYDKYNKPSDMLSQFFNTLYDEEVISEEAFMKWKQNEDPKRQEAKGPALQATSSFFEWLQSAAVENEN